jgi:prepilin-type N-terminal cleavage/methylation domain-containing protein/prepilin-type processing-associated H-X9-DG protein
MKRNSASSGARKRPILPAVSAWPSGFTLVELMVVIAIISVLTALTLPVGLRAREMSRRASCATNLRQIGVAFSMYVDDWDGAFPNTSDPYLWMGRRWRWPLEPYLGGGLRRDPAAADDPLQSSRTSPILLCPSDPSAREQWDATSYGYSAAFYHTRGQIAAMTTEDLWQYDRFPCVTQRESYVRHPGKKVLVTEWLTNHDEAKVGWWDWSGSRNYLFVDGHVRYLSASQIRPAVNGLPDPNLTVGGISGKDVD